MREAQIRLHHNRQRAQLKAHLREVAGPTSTAVSREQVEMAARLANIELPGQVFDSALANQYALRRGAGGDVQAVDYQKLVRAMDHPKMGSDPDGAVRDYLARIDAKKAAKAERAAAAAAAARQASRSAAAGRASVAPASATRGPRGAGGRGCRSVLPPLWAAQLPPLVPW